MYLPHQPYNDGKIKALIGVIILIIFYIGLMFSLPIALFAEVAVIGGPPTITSTDTSFISTLGENWHFGIDKVGTRKVLRVDNDKTNRYFQMSPVAPSAWMNASKQDQRVTVEYLWSGVDLTYVDVNRQGFEISHVISDSNKLNNNTIRWFIQTNMPNRSVSGDTLYYANKKAHIAPAIAWDAEGDTLTVTRAISYVNNSVQTFGDSVFRITDNITGTGIVMPVWYDPSVIINTQTGFGGHFKNTNATYATARGATSAGSADASYFWGAEPGYDIWRGFLLFPLQSVPVGATVDSAIVTFTDLNYSRVAANFNWGIIASNTQQLSNVANWDLFPGWASTTNPYTNIVKYSPFVNTSSAAATIVLKLNSVGIDSLEANLAGDDTLAMFILSAEDSASSQPASNERMQVVDGVTNPPRLTVYYTGGGSSGLIVGRSRGTILYEKFPPTGRITGKVLSQPYRRNP